VAGILGNFFLGWLLISYLFTQGVPSPTNKIIVEQVVKNSPAALADIKEGDIVKSLATANNKITANLKNTDELINYSKKDAGQEVVL
jgi:membrane-associated protease RseP (regulator of RpoE activity)